MKHFSIMPFLFLIHSLVVGQKLDPSNVPGKVKSTFAKLFPGIQKISWEREAGDYEANFKMDGQSISALFKPDGSFIESELAIKINELPESIREYMKERYKKFPVREASRIIAASGVITYEAGIKGKDIIFDIRGSFLKEQQD
jgi:hypothetical protein